MPVTITNSTSTQASVGVVNQEELIKRLTNLTQVYSPEQIQAYAFYLKRLDKAKENRNKATKYFDGLDYVSDYITNENVKNTYLKPKMNDSEVRVNTGLVEKKIEAILNELLTMNLQPEVRVFDRDDLELEELGQDFTDIITRTNQIEKDDDFWIEATLELLTQRAVFIREKFVTKTLKNKTSKITQAQKELVSGLKVFLGDVSIPAYRFNEQPYITTVDIISYDRAKTLYGHLPNFQYVVPSNTKRNEYLGGALNWRMSELADGEVEVVTYESLPDDEYNVVLNGVMMYEPGTPMPQKYCDKYSLQMFVLKSMSPDFAYGRPLTASAKSLAALSSETLRLLIRKFQQAIEPPMAVAKGKVYSRDIWDPGAQTQGLRAKDFEILTKHDGVTQGEFAMIRLIDEKTEEFIGASNIAQGLQGSREMSATEVLTMQKQFVKQLGLAVYAISRMKRDMSELRIYNILENYTKPTRKKYDPLSQKIQHIYRSFTIDNGMFENGMMGKKIISFTNEDLIPEQQEELYNEEEKMAKRGQPTRYKFINVTKLKEIPQFWYVIIQAQDREGTALDKVLFQDQLNQGAVISKLTGQPMNPDTLTRTFERKWQARNFFQKQAPQIIQDQPENIKSEAEKVMNELQGMGQNTGMQVAEGLRNSQQRPSVNSMEGQSME